MLLAIKKKPKKWTWAPYGNQSDKKKVKETVRLLKEEPLFTEQNFNDFEIDNRDNLALCKRQDNKLNIAFTNDVQRCFEKINTLNTTMNKKFKALIDDDLQDSFYDFKEQHITPIKDDLKVFNDLYHNHNESIKALEEVQGNNDKTIFNEVATLKEHIKSVETFVNELCELNQINERG